MEEKKKRGRPRKHPPRVKHTKAEVSAFRKQAAALAHDALRKRIEAQAAEMLARGYIQLADAARLLEVHYSTLFRHANEERFVTVRARFPRRAYADLKSLVAWVGEADAERSGLKKLLEESNAGR